MTLRNIIILVFISVSGLAFILFGFIAFQISEDSSASKEKSLFLDFLQKDADQFSRVLGGNSPKSEFTRLTNTIKSKYYYFALLQDEIVRYSSFSIPDNRGVGTLLDTDDLSELPMDDEEFSRFLLSNKEVTSGIVGEDAHAYVWAVSRVPKTSYKIAAFKKLNHDFGSHFSTVGTRLFGAGLITIWFAIWGALGISALVSKRLKKSQKKLIYQALHDSLTDLPNRTLLVDRLNQLIMSAKRNCRPILLLVLDFDHFKEINKTFGLETGDKLIKIVAKYLENAVRESDTVARLSGNEFAILMPGADVSQADACFYNIKKALSNSVTANDVEVDIRYSVGGAAFPDHGSDPHILLRHAEVAMDQSRHSESDYLIYAPGMDAGNVRKLSLLTELRKAIENRTLTLHYQPKVDLASGKVVGTEALLRWRHKDLGFVPTIEFISIAEHSGLIKQLTELVLGMATQQYREWSEHGLTLPIAVNLSARNLLDHSLVNDIKNFLESSNMSPMDLHLEITESAMMAEPKRAKAVLESLNELGVRLAIDDFGTGYSSLAYLKDLPVNDIKIDRSFVMDMLRDKNDEVIVRSTIDLSHNLGYKVIAEGIEDQETLELLKQHGCDTGQGYHIARPMPPEDLIDWLSNYPSGPVSANSRKLAG